MEQQKWCPLHMNGAPWQCPRCYLFAVVRDTSNFDWTDKKMIEVMLKNRPDSLFIIWLVSTPFRKVYHETPNHSKHADKATSFSKEEVLEAVFGTPSVKLASVSVEVKKKPKPKPRNKWAELGKAYANCSKLMPQPQPRRYDDGEVEREYATRFGRGMESQA